MPKPKNKKFPSDILGLLLFAAAIAAFVVSQELYEIYLFDPIEGLGWLASVVLAASSAFLCSLRPITVAGAIGMVLSVAYLLYWACWLIVKLESIS